MRTRLLLIRHGRSTWNAQGRWQGQANPPLDDLGRDQARRLAGHLRARGTVPAAIYASSLARAAETASILGEAFGLAPVLDDRLIEYHVGVFQGLTLAECAERYPELWARFRGAGDWIAVPGAEDREAFCDRAVAAFEEVLARHPEQTVAVVTHGGVLGAYLTCALGLGKYRHSPFGFGNGSLSILEHSGGSARLILLNDTCHLDGPEPGAGSPRASAPGPEE